MICSALKRRGPYIQPCNKCLYCRVNRKQEWVSRLLLESACHPAAWFVTLTYAPHHLPEADRFEGGNLVPGHLRDFLKRLRARVDYRGGGRLRFLACGEYGEKTARAHYHCILFGNSLEEAEVTESWPYGFSSVAPGVYSRFAYVAGYVVKKFNDQRWVSEGRCPPFLRMSRNPGLGVPAVLALKKLIEEGGHDALVFGDVPRAWVHEGRQRPLGRTVRTWLREAVFADGADAVRTEAAAQQWYWLSLLLKLDGSSYDPQLSQSKKNAQMGLRVLHELLGKEQV